MAKVRKMITDWKAPYIQSLMKLIETQSKVTLVNWAVDYAQRAILPLWIDQYPNDQRPQNSLKAAREWLSGAVKLPQAKRAILKCHEAAREAEETPIAQAAARAVAQSSSTIHSARHCIGLALYGAIAVAYDRIGTDVSWDLIEKYIAEECGRMEAALRKVAFENEKNPAKIIWKC